jgi:hypothetical protein
MGGGQGRGTGGSGTNIKPLPALQDCKFGVQCRMLAPEHPHNKVHVSRLVHHHHPS